LNTGTHVAIIAVTAHVLNGDADQCYTAGADAYLPKPINLTDLIALLKVTAESFPRPDTDPS
jgi:CheY-like chemotaxis protein